MLGVVTTTSRRVHWAVGVLGLRADARVLEVGGGTGASARQVCGLLTTGHLLAQGQSQPFLDVEANVTPQRSEAGQTRAPG